MRKLSMMSWKDVQEEMSTSGSPEKLTQIGKYIMALVQAGVDTTNPAEIINAELALQRVLAELKLMKRHNKQKSG